jgi:hypothetical protein
MKLGLVDHIYNPNTPVGRFHVPGQPELHSETLSQRTAAATTKTVPSPPQKKQNTLPSKRKTLFLAMHKLFWKGGEMTQTLYAHMNKRNTKIFLNKNYLTIQI